MCAREEKEERKKEKEVACTGALTAAAQPFSPPHLLRLLSGPFLVYSLRCKQATASLGESGLQVKNRGYQLHLHPQWLTSSSSLPVSVHQGLISSPAQNAGRVIALSVKTQPVATWLVYTRGCSNNVVRWQAATTIFSPLFIHLLSHLALLVILALTLNQIYHAVGTVSVFILFSVASLLFLFGTVNLSWSLFFSTFLWASFFSLSDSVRMSGAV